MGNYDFELDLKSVNTMSVINNWIQEETKVLEFGPANGRLTKYLKFQKNCKVTIVELDKEAGKEASCYATKAYIGNEYGNIENYYWTKTKEKFDYIIFADVLEHLSNPQKVLGVCKEFLEPTGRILVSIPNVAHNSVIIDMLNDKFEYDEVGLLDRTHIHFFTLKTFQKMISLLDIYIAEMIPIYSRVGSNEILNTYKDVPIDVEKYMRKRLEGSVYQYVFNLSLDRDRKTEITLKNFDLDEYEEAEAQIFLKTGEQDYNDHCRVTKKYRINQNLEWTLELNQYYDVQYIRIDPLENNGIIYLEKCIFDIDGVDKQVSIINSNALARYNNIFIFDNIDPWFEVKLPKEYVGGKIVVEFRVLDYGRKLRCYYDLVKFLEKNGITFQGENQSNITRIVNLNMHSDIEKQKEYIKHLETDIKRQQEYILHMESDRTKQREYIIKLEADTNEQHEYITKLEEDTKEQHEYIVKLEADGKEQCEFMAHLQKDIDELKEYITQLENQ